MGLMLMAAGIFSGIGVFMATLYSLSQAVLRQGRRRYLHLAILIAILAVMAALQLRAIGLARVLALPLLMLGAWATLIEPRWYKAFPILVQLFAAALLAGLVAL